MSTLDTSFQGNGEPLWRSLVEQLALSFGEELARQVAEQLAQGARVIWRSMKPPSRPESISPLAVRNYLRGSPFGHLGREQVEAWAASELAALAPQSRTLVFQAIANSCPERTAQGVLRCVVAYFAQQR